MWRDLGIICLLVDGYNDGTTQTDIVLQAVFDVGDLSLASPASSLPYKFCKARVIQFDFLEKRVQKKYEPVH